MDTLTAESRARDLVSKMTLKEKFKILTSSGIRRMYSTNPMKRLDIPSFRMTDGPLGIAYHSSGLTKGTRFPATIALAASWNRSLAKEMGVAMAEEVRAVNRHMLLAPGINIVRTPLNGRTFEYFSEDPYLTKELAIPLVQGVQSLGVGSCVKHYAANNQEIDRRSSSSELDERTLHEIYLRAFREVVLEADPYSIMGSYNMVNGTYGCENEYLNREILMNKWGFKGFIVSDWFATRPIETAFGCINGGLSLEMPLPSKYKKKILKTDLDEGRFEEETLDDLVYRFLRVMFLTGAFEPRETLPKGSLNTPEHQNLARRIAEEGMVLLKNEGDMLPLKKESIASLALLGPNLKQKFGRLFYGGSSAVKPPYEITPLEGIKEKLRGTAKLRNKPAESDLTIIFAGLNHDKGKDSESYDRSDLRLPEDQVQLINTSAKDNPNTIVVLLAGSAISMEDWADNVPVILDAWYPGMEGGRAIANVLFGESVPSGKLPITFPRKLSDSPAHQSGDPRNYPGDNEKRVYYDEGIFVGYRWFDQKGIEPLFPFGFGLSYTEFKIKHVIEAENKFPRGIERITLNVEIENIGTRTGAEVIQVYSTDLSSSIPRPQKELVAFQKVWIGQGERKTIPITIKSKDLMFYNIEKHDWVFEPGEFKLQVGNSTRNITDEVTVNLE